jgi:hypothetical protein
VNSEIQASLWGENPAGLIGVVRDEIGMKFLPMLYVLIFAVTVE